jgi:hypothetical protein
VYGSRWVSLGSGMAPIVVGLTTSLVAESCCLEPGTAFIRKIDLPLTRLFLSAARVALLLIGFSATTIAILSRCLLSRVGLLPKSVLFSRSIAFSIPRQSHDRQCNR